MFIHHPQTSCAYHAVPYILCIISSIDSPNKLTPSKMTDIDNIHLHRKIRPGKAHMHLLSGDVTINGILYLLVVPAIHFIGQCKAAAGAVANVHMGKILCCQQLG